VYLEIVRDVVLGAVRILAAADGRRLQDVLAQIRSHIDRTAEEHWSDEPEIDYDDPMCRLGYLYRHAAANATLFEQALRRSDELRKIMHDAGHDAVDICSVGGGPGVY
jgi:hypothetical protein